MEFKQAIEEAKSNISSPNKRFYPKIKAKSIKHTKHTHKVKKHKKFKNKFTKQTKMLPDRYIMKSGKIKKRSNKGTAQKI